MKLRNRYSRWDRLLYRLAFATVTAQKGMASIEDSLYARRIAGVNIERPVFITSLPRAGTTLLLELIAALPDFVSHTYRDMPCLLTPLLWNGLSRPFRVPGTVVERAHGDGMTVGYDSPEAFEELLWHAFWPEKYRVDRIVPWQADDRDTDGEFEGFMRSHVRKLLALRAEDVSGTARYVSKNNVGIARIPLIARLFPDASILVPFRNPVDQAGSMLRQHCNFLGIHCGDPFSRRYMEYIGHFDFGANIRPIDFGHWLDDAGVAPPRAADFWLRYWCAAFEHVLANRCENVFLVSYDRCCSRPSVLLRSIGQRIGLAETDEFVEQAHRFRAPVGYDAEDLGMTPELLQRATAIHGRLLEAAER